MTKFKRTTIQIASIFAVLTVNAVAADAPWLARYNGPANKTDQNTKVAADINGNIYVTGRSDDALSIPDFLTIKYDSSGNKLWEQRLDYGTGWDVPNAIAVDKAGNVYVTGDSQITRNGSYGYLTVKYDTNGTELWRRRHDGPANNNNAKAIAVDANGNAYVTGSSASSTDVNSQDYLTVKYDPNGSTLWERRYNSPVNLYDGASLVAIDSRGDVVVSGVSMGGTLVGITTGTSVEDILTLKYSPTGTLLWERRFENSASSDIPRAVSIDAFDNIVLTGNTTSSLDTTNTNMLTVKYDRDGNFLWKQVYDGSLHMYDYGFGVASDSAGNAYVTGFSVATGNFADMTTFKFSPSGQVLWERHERGGYTQGFGKAIALDAQGNVFVGGKGEVSYDKKSDFLTAKYDSNGNLLWLQRYNGPGDNNDEITDLVVDINGNVIVSGSSFGGTTTFYDFATVKYVGPEPFLPPAPQPPPTPQQVGVASFQVLQGTIISGANLTAVQSSDNSYMTLQPVRSTTPAQVSFDAAAPTTTPSALSFNLEAATTLTNITQTVELYNFTTKAYEQLSQGTVSTSDAQFKFTLSGDLSRFVETGTNRLRARLTYTPPSKTSAWTARIDQVFWYVTK